ncbi:MULTISPECIES: hypothetical protein [Kitasatospora]|uniref:Uncharacterized protein n=1 Tax=Kitasatospora cystarginea TaxID=58350 RepID=A0ABN3F026_9ACTN
MTSKKPATHHSMDEGQASRHQGRHHGWSSDIDAEHQEPNDSAHRSFHPDSYAPEPGPGREPAEEEHREVPGNTVHSEGTRGEEQGPSKHRRDYGPQGPSGRPAGGYTQKAHTGVAPKEPQKPEGGR